MEGHRDARYARFLELLKQARRDAKLTQADVARRLGKPQSFMSKIETGERRLDFVEVAELAAIYGVPLEFFLPRKTSRRQNEGRR